MCLRRIEIDDCRCLCRVDIADSCHIAYRRFGAVGRTLRNLAIGSTLRNLTIGSTLRNLAIGSTLRNLAIWRIWRIWRIRWIGGIWHDREIWRIGGRQLGIACRRHDAVSHARSGHRFQAPQRWREGFDLRFAARLLRAFEDKRYRRLDDRGGGHGEYEPEDTSGKLACQEGEDDDDGVQICLRTDDFGREEVRIDEVNDEDPSQHEEGDDGPLDEPEQNGGNRANNRPEYRHDAQRSGDESEQ